MKMVQVTSEAKASPIMTALTSTSADLNIDHGDNSRSSAAAAFSNLPSRSGGAAVVSEGAAGAAVAVGWAGCVAWAGAAGACETAGACWTAEGAGGAAPCRADDGAASDSIASAEITANIITRERDMFFILQPSSGSGCDRCRSI